MTVTVAVGTITLSSVTSVSKTSHNVELMSLLTWNFPVAISGKLTAYLNKDLAFIFSSIYIMAHIQTNLVI